MRAEVMSAGLLRMADERRMATGDRAAAAATTASQTIALWTPESFARGEIRRLVRQVFLARGPQSIRQVVFSAVEPEADISTICLRVGEALATETSADVAVVGTSAMNGSRFAGDLLDSRNDAGDGRGPLRRMATRLTGNLWLLPHEMAQARHKSTSLHGFLAEVRGEFEYSILQARPDADSSVTADAAQAGDGLILVISAQRTRRAAALKVKQMLEQAQVRILGAVLSDREFPIPERIYRRL